MAKTTGDIFIDPIVVWGDDKDNSNDSMGDNNNNSIDTRFLFPEYASGAVPRLFSTLQYQSTTSPTPTTTSSSRPVVVVATHATGSVGAAAALVTGTTVGAGILALPAATAPAGFLPSSVALIFGYGIMTVSGLLLAELLLNRWGQTGKPDSTGIMDLYNNNNNGATSPSVGSMAVAQLSRMAYFFLHYALMVAYIAQGGSLVSNAVSNVWLSDVISATVTLPPVLLHLGRDAVLGPILFTATMGTTLFVSNKTTMQQLNNALVTGVFATFVGTLVVSAAAVQESTTTTLSSSYSTLWDPANLHPNELWNALPVIFLAFVFHNIIPVIVKDLEGDRTKIAQAILLGSVIPLGMFLAWNAMVLAILPSDITAATAATIDPIALFQQNTDGNYGALLTGFVTSFSMLAIVTSLIGFTYGLLDAWADFLKLDSVSLGQRKLQLFGLIFLPPLAFALANPDVFQTALEYGGAFGVSTLFLLLPPIMVWKERYGDQQSPLVTKPLVPFGKFPLVILVMVSVTLILQQAAEKAGFY